MTKSELREKWSKYCNTDVLVDNMIALLNKYSHDNSEHGVCVLLDTYFTNKESLIKMMLKSKHYIGDMRISVQQKFDRTISREDVFYCLDNFQSQMNLNSMLKFVDDKGKCLDDYLPVGKKLFNVNDLPDNESQDERLEKMRQFNYSNKATKTSMARQSSFYSYVYMFQRINYSKLQSDIPVDSDNGGPMLKAGTKTSRAFNKMCHYYGVDKLNPQTVSAEENGKTVQRTVYPYDKLFATYADMVSDLQRKLHFVISLNPLDYLTMSIGVNWKSCHSIAGGGWKGGCLSYMLDNTSMITYVVTDLMEPIHEMPKVYRQMFHYDNGMFVQNRLYPQGNDGATNLYDKFRGFVIDEFKPLIDENGTWEAEVGWDACRRHTDSVGVHYKDYNSNPSCSVFYPKAKAETVRDRIMTIGHEGICVRCGRSYSYSSRLAHNNLTDCLFD